jgi:hypothetical protein
MATIIKSIPILKSNDAERFIKDANKSFTKKATMDCSKQMSITKLILAKAKIK